MGRNIIESERCKQAFYYYYNLGENRSYYATAQWAGVSSASVQAWAKKYEWQDRVKEMDLKNGESILLDSDAALVVEMSRNRDIIKSGLKDFLQRLNKGEVRVDKVRDAVNLMKLDMELAQFINQLRHQNDVNSTDVKISIDTKQTIENLMTQLNNLPEDTDVDDAPIDVYDDLINYDMVQDAE